MKIIIKRTIFRGLPNRARPWTKLFFLPILSTLCLASNLDAQYAHLAFEQISIEQGLSQSIVFCAIQDHPGFMWFGTMDTAALSAKEIKDKIISEVKRFSGATQQDDDMTVIVVKVT